jgi:hypothetical protein
MFDPAKKGSGKIKDPGKHGTKNLKMIYGTPKFFGDSMDIASSVEEWERAPPME